MDRRRHDAALKTAARKSDASLLFLRLIRFDKCFWQMFWSIWEQAV